MEHEGRAVVFEDAADLAARIDDPSLDVNADDILVLKRIGPKGAPGMPEAGALPIPLKLARAGVKDMVRISDGRMSGTAFGTVVLHVTEAEMAARRAAQPLQPPAAERGYRKLFLQHVTQADRGVDFDFLQPASNGRRIPSA